MEYKLKSKQRENLMRLSIYLDTLPKDYEEFDMSDYFEREGNDMSGKLERKYARKNGGVASCGTSACAVGHGPSAGILVPEDLIIKRPGWDGMYRWKVDWGTYTVKKFTGGDDTLFTWMFGGEWSGVDNHHYGAAARMVLPPVSNIF